MKTALQGLLLLFREFFVSGVDDCAKFCSIQPVRSPAAQSDIETYFPPLGNTNGSRYEVFALFGETYGSGAPLGYLCLQSRTRDEGGKTRYLWQFLRHFRQQWAVCPTFTLSDKDWSEINAFLQEFGDAEHQLCFWHALRALKKRLAILRRQPAFYNVQNARLEYDWIDANFVPAQQQQRDVSRFGSVYRQEGLVAYQSFSPLHSLTIMSLQPPFPTSVSG